MYCVAGLTSLNRAEARRLLYSVSVWGGEGRPRLTTPRVSVLRMMLPRFECNSGLSCVDMMAFIIFHVWEHREPRGGRGRKA